MSLNTSPFAQVQNHSALNESRRQYFLPGKYRVRIDNVLLHKKRLGGFLFVVESTCLESSNPEVAVGEQRNWAQSMELDAAIPRIKCFLGAAHGLCPKRDLDKLNAFVTQELCDEAVSPENPLKGKELTLECFNKASQRTGKDFLVHLWLP